MYIDTHCHLYPEFDFVTLKPEEIVENSIKAGVLQMWLASTEKADIEWNLNFCKKYPNNLKTWVGWHPEQYLSYDKDFLARVLDDNITLKFSNPNFQFSNKTQIQNSSASPQNDLGKGNTKYQILDTAYSSIVGIGEVGVDLAVHPKNSTVVQQQVFETQIKLAQKYNLPVALHCRDAFDETLEVMEKYPNISYLWHCFNLSSDKTKILLKRFPNIFCAFNAIFTYKSGEYLKESIKLIPLERIVFETDGPFLAPRPFKYSFNTPEGVMGVYKAVSETLNINIEKLEFIVNQNCIGLTTVPSS